MEVTVVDTNNLYKEPLADERDKLIQDKISALRPHITAEKWRDLEAQEAKLEARKSHKRQKEVSSLEDNCFKDESGERSSKKC